MSELTQKEIDELRSDLAQLRNSLTDTLQQIEKASETVELDQQAFGRVSRIGALQQQNMAKANHKQSQNRLRQVMQALARVDSGDYGFCINCNGNIGFPRLKARPETPRCLKCQSLQEQN